MSPYRKQAEVNMINGDAPKHCIYVAAPLGEARRAAAIAELARAVGYHVVSTWHDVVRDGATDPPSTKLRQLIFNTCVAEVDRAHVVIGLLTVGNPRATYCEIGWALSKGIPVVWLADEKRTCIFDAHPYSLRIESERDLWGTVKTALSLREP